MIMAYVSSGVKENLRSKSCPYNKRLAALREHRMRCACGQGNCNRRSMPVSLEFYDQTCIATAGRRREGKENRPGRINLPQSHLRQRGNLYSSGYSKCRFNLYNRSRDNLRECGPCQTHHSIFRPRKRNLFSTRREPSPGFLF